MDLSKLPKMSQTPPPPANPEVVPTDIATSTPTPPKVELFCRCGAPIVAGTNFCSHCGASYRQSLDYREAEPSAGVGAEAWLSVAIGVILIFLMPNIWKYYLAHASFTGVYNDAQGNPLAYTQTEFYWADLGVAAFAVVMILEGIVMLLARKATIVLLAMVLTVTATLLNIYVLSRTFGLIGFQVINALAAAFGFYIALYEFNLWKSLRGAGR